MILLDEKLACRIIFCFHKMSQNSKGIFSYIHLSFRFSTETSIPIKNLKIGIAYRISQILIFAYILV